MFICFLFGWNLIFFSKKKEKISGDQRWRDCVAFWEVAVLSCLCWWQEETEDHRQSAIKTAETSFSLSAFMRAGSARLPVSTWDLISLPCVVMETRIWVIQCFSSVMLAAVFMLWPENPTQQKYHDQTEKPNLEMLKKNRNQNHDETRDEFV